MKTYEVKNGHHRSKAVLVAGGHVIVKPGETKMITAEWPDVLIAKYLEAGLKIEESGGVATASSANEPDRAAQIAELIGGLDPAQDFTEGGKPDVRKINALASEGFPPVTADERDAVWATMQAAG